MLAAIISYLVEISEITTYYQVDLVINYSVLIFSNCFTDKAICYAKTI